MSTATRAKRKDSGSWAIAGNTCAAITASSGRAAVRRSAASSSSSVATTRGRRAAVLLLVRKVLRSACIRYASSSHRAATAAARGSWRPSPGRGPPRSPASHTAPARSATGDRGARRGPRDRAASDRTGKASPGHRWRRWTAVIGARANRLVPMPPPERRCLGCCAETWLPAGVSANQAAPNAVTPWPVDLAGLLCP